MCARCDRLETELAEAKDKVRTLIEAMGDERARPLAALLGLTLTEAVVLMRLYETSGAVTLADLGLNSRGYRYRADSYRKFICRIREALGDARCIDTTRSSVDRATAYEMTGFGRASLDELMEWG